MCPVINDVTTRAIFGQACRSEQGVNTQGIEHFETAFQVNHYFKILISVANGCPRMSLDAY